MLFLPHFRRRAIISSQEIVPPSPSPYQNANDRRSSNHVLPEPNDSDILLKMEAKGPKSWNTHVRWPSDIFRNSCNCVRYSKETLIRRVCVIVNRTIRKVPCCFQPILCYF
ncbi:Protein of unknown function [Pyronema omphalodes CBS 100304]|uniref:Uncharacterized protein n=1 Tax=Pyronema omphalodes (strain CBS 100304) TaxID=1076935 RepID=U4L8C1_PYROM|nr:Protein of unknown function [Pyronema omphalodes CBS 100304]